VGWGGACLGGRAVGCGDGIAAAGVGRHGLFFMTCVCDMVGGVWCGVVWCGVVRVGVGFGSALGLEISDGECIRRWMLV
jgi:hypothetical protein